MYNPDTEILFPPRILLDLREARGEAWQNLVSQVIAIEEKDHIDRIAMVLMMLHLNGCSTCQVDSYRSLIGCTQCSTQTLKRFRGEDTELLTLYKQAHGEVERSLKGS